MLIWLGDIWTKSLINWKSHESKDDMASETHESKQNKTKQFLPG